MYYYSIEFRWLSSDPVQQYSSPYVYCGNDPVNKIDPTGMWSTDDDDPMKDLWGFPPPPPKELDSGYDPFHPFGGSGDGSNNGLNGGYVYEYSWTETDWYVNGEYQYSTESTKKVTGLRYISNGYETNPGGTLYNIAQSGNGGGGKGGSDALYILGIAAKYGKVGTDNINTLLKGGIEFYEDMNSFSKAVGIEYSDEITKITKLANYAKNIGTGLVILGAAVDFTQGIDALLNGDVEGAKLAGYNMGLGITSAIAGGPAGVLIYIVGKGILTPPPGMPSTPLPKVPLIDNTYVAPNY